MSEITAVRVVVRGLVQGVGYRWSARSEAERLGVAGWIRNESDGTVMGHFEGAPAAVDALVAWCGRGPYGARVTGVSVQVTPPADRSGFVVG